MVREFDPNGSDGVVVDGTDGTDGRGGMMVGALVGWFRVGSTGAGADPAGATGSSRELGGAGLTRRS